MADERDFCESCGTIFGDGVSNSQCTFYTNSGHRQFVCVSCYEELGGYDEAEQYKRQQMFKNLVKEHQNIHPMG